MLLDYVGDPTPESPSSSRRLMPEVGITAAATFSSNLFSQNDLLILRHSASTMGGDIVETAESCSRRRVIEMVCARVRAMYGVALSTTTKGLCDSPFSLGLVTKQTFIVC